MPKVDLYEFNGLGLILSWSSGVVYGNQVGGLGCLQPEVEGVFVPLSDGIGRPVIYALSQHFRGDWHPISDSDADIFDGILRRANLSFIMTDRRKLNDSYESWIFIEVREGGQNSEIPLLSGFGTQKGVLTWPNSD